MRFRKTAAATAPLFALLISLPKAGAVAQSSASPEQIRGTSTYAHALAAQATTYGAPIIAMYLLRNSVAFGMHPLNRSITTPHRTST